MEDHLPDFRYHPDPVATGSLEESEAPCEICGAARGWLYVGPVFSRAPSRPHVCPWCIASGEAAARLDCTFTTLGGDAWANVPDAVRDQILRRTPGFPAWQEPMWLACDGDAAAYLGAFGAADLIEVQPAVIDAVRGAATALAGEAASEVMSALSTEHPPTAFLFMCLDDGQFLAVVDAT